MNDSDHGLRRRVDFIYNASLLYIARKTPCITLGGSSRNLWVTLGLRTAFLFHILRKVVVPPHPPALPVFACHGEEPDKPSSQLDQAQSLYLHSIVNLLPGPRIRELASEWSLQQHPPSKFCPPGSILFPFFDAVKVLIGIAPSTLARIFGLKKISGTDLA